MIVNDLMLDPYNASFAELLGFDKEFVINPYLCCIYISYIVKSNIFYIRVTHILYSRFYHFL